MIVHMTGLYTRLVTYAKLHILTLVVSFYHDTSYISFITLFLILIILLSSISVYHVVIAYIIFLHEHLLLYIHSLGRFWQSWIRTSKFLDTLYCSGGRVIVRFARIWSFSLFISGILISLVFLLFPDFRYISDSVFISVLFIWYHVWMLICDIAVIIDLLWFRFIACPG